MYENVSDEELIVRLRQGETQITDYIMDKYKHLVRKKAKSMFILGGDNDDLIQEGMIGLFKAIRDYDIGRDASFFTFADLCVFSQNGNHHRTEGRNLRSLILCVLKVDNAVLKVKIFVLYQTDRSRSVSAVEKIVDDDPVSILGECAGAQIGLFQKQR